MGNYLYSGGVVFVENKNATTAKKPVRVDERRRNSLAFYIARFLKYDGDDYNELVLEVKKERESHMTKKRASVRDQKNSQVAEAIALGSLQETREQVIHHFRKINRNYKDPWAGNTLTHIMCQEGYHSMLQFVFDPTKHSQFDHVDIDLNNTNDRARVPFFLSFSPPSATYTGLTNGLNDNGIPNGIKPEIIELINDWVKPGFPRERENIIGLLIESGQDIHVKDFHNYTAIHYTCMWGWLNTLKLLIKEGSEVNCATQAGRTPLMFAVEFGHILCTKELLNHPHIHINNADVDGVTALIIAIERDANKGTELVQLLLEKGADPNIETLRKKTPLKVAAKLQNVDIVNLLLDHNVQRRPSALSLLTGSALQAITKRIERDEAEAKRLADLANQEQDEEEGEEEIIHKHRTSPWGAWTLYHDKRGRGNFYYNTVSRISQWDRPKDYSVAKDAGRVKGVRKEATFGMHFYN